MSRWRWMLGFSIGSLTYAQSGVLTGKALDSHETPVASAKVWLLRRGDKQPTTTETDSAGVYRFKIPGGRYTVQLEGDTALKPVEVVPGKITILNLTVTQAQFFDEPHFTVAGVTDNTYRGGHGSDTVLRSSEELAKATALLSSDDSPASLYELSGRPFEAVKELRRKAVLEPNEVNLFAWGKELLSHRASQAAIEVFTKGVRLFPSSVRMLLGLASASYEEGLYSEATRWFFRATDLASADPTPYLFLSKVKATEITESQGYEDRLARFARLQPNNVWANYYYGAFLWDSRRDAAARSLLEKAASLDPHAALPQLELGKIFASQERYPEAISSYRKAIDRDPSLEEAHYRLSDAYRVTGDRTAAEVEGETYRHLSKLSAEKVEGERRETQRFVIALGDSGKPQ